MLVHEFVRAGFRRVGILRGGFQSLRPAHRAALVCDAVTPDAPGASQGGGQGGGAAGSTKEKAAAALGRLKGRMNSMGDRAKAAAAAMQARRAKPAPALNFGGGGSGV